MRLDKFVRQDYIIYLNKCDGFIELFLYDTTEINYPKRKTGKVKDPRPA